MKFDDPWKGEGMRKGVEYVFCSEDAPTPQVSLPCKRVVRAIEPARANKKARTSRTSNSSPEDGILSYHNPKTIFCCLLTSLIVHLAYEDEEARTVQALMKYKEEIAAEIAAEIAKLKEFFLSHKQNISSIRKLHEMTPEMTPFILQMIRNLEQEIKEQVSQLMKFYKAAEGFCAFNKEQIPDVENDERHSLSFLNNNPENLEWCSHSQNVRHAVDTGLVKRQRVNPTGMPVIQRDLSGKEVAKFPTISKAGKKTGISYKKIHTVCAGKRKQAGGFVWEYV